MGMLGVSRKLVPRTRVSRNGNGKPKSRPIDVRWSQHTHAHDSTAWVQLNPNIARGLLVETKAP